MYSYPLLMGIAWGVAYNLSRYFLTSYGEGTKGFRGLFWGVFITSWIGAKTFFIIHSSAGDYLYASSTYFWLGGGFVFYGGLIFSSIFVLLYGHYLKFFNLSSAYLLLPALTIGHAVGRFGCFLAGCCYGTTCKLPWAIKLHGELRHPVQLYEALGLLLLGILLITLITKKINSKKIVFIYFGGYALERFGLEFFRGDKVRGHYLGGQLSTSQFISIIIVILVLLTYLYNKFKVKQGAT